MKLIHKIEDCARCEGTHEFLTAQPLKNPPEGWTHWALCPVRRQPILISLSGEEADELPPREFPGRDYLMEISRIARDLSICSQTAINQITGFLAHLGVPVPYPRACSVCHRLCRVDEGVLQEHEMLVGDPDKRCPASGTTSWDKEVP